MAIRSLKNGTFSRSLLVGNTYYDPGQFFQIATAYGTGSAGDIVFSSIPQTYKHLQLRIIARGSNGINYADAANVYYNTDSTATNYWMHQFYNSSSSAVTSTGYNLRPQVIQAGGGSTPSATYAVTIMDILDYTSTSKNKTSKGFIGLHTNGGPYGSELRLTSSMWNSTSAINTITIVGNPGFTTNSIFALYGVKG